MMLNRITVMIMALLILKLELITLFRIVDHFPVPDLWQQLHCLETCS